MQHQCSKVVKHLYSWCPIWHVWQIKRDLFKRGGNKSYSGANDSFFLFSLICFLGFCLFPHLFAANSFSLFTVIESSLKLWCCQNVLCVVYFYLEPPVSNKKKINIEMNMTQRNIPEPNKVYDLPNRWKDYFFYIWWELEKLSIFA